MPRMTCALATVLCVGGALAGCGTGPEPSPTLSGAAARTAQDNVSRVRQLLAPVPARPGERPRAVGPVALVVPAGFVASDDVPRSPPPGWRYHRLTHPRLGERTALGVVVAPATETDAKAAAETIARTGGSRTAGEARGFVTTTDWHGTPAHLVYVNTSTGLHVEALTATTAAGVVTVIAQAPTSDYAATGLRRALTSVDLAP